MRKTPTVEYVHEGRLVAEVDVTLIETDSEWSPYYDIADVRKVEAVREALRRGDLKGAAKLAKVYELTPIAAE